MEVLRRLLAPLDPGTFLSDRFQRQNTYIPGESGKFDFFFPVSHFRENLDRVSHIRAIFKGFQEVDISPADIPAMVSAGATICVTGLERAHPALLALVTELRAETRHPGMVSVRAYMSPPGSGFDPHYDARTVTTLQLYGEKAWRIGRSPFVSFPQSNCSDFADPDYKDFDTLTAADEVLMRPGDLLCLPPGTVHTARARSWCLALNVAFDYVGARYLDLIQHEFSAVCAADLTLREPLAPADAITHARLRDEVNGRIARMQQLLQELSSSVEWLSPAREALEAEQMSERLGTSSLVKSLAEGRLWVSEG